MCGNYLTRIFLRNAKSESLRLTSYPSGAVLILYEMTVCVKAANKPASFTIPSLTSTKIFLKFRGVGLSFTDRVGA